MGQTKKEKKIMSEVRPTSIALKKDMTTTFKSAFEHFVIKPEVLPESNSVGFTITRVDTTTGETESEQWIRLTYKDIEGQAHILNTLLNELDLHIQKKAREVELKGRYTAYT
jgi:hypothetical protein